MLSGGQQLTRRPLTGRSATAAAASVTLSPLRSRPAPSSSSVQATQTGLPVEAAPDAAARASAALDIVSHK